MLESVLAQAPDTAHELVLLGDAAACRRWSSKNAPGVVLPVVQTRPGRAERLLRRGLHRVLRQPAQANVPESVEQLLLRHGVQALVHFGPWNILTTEIPFL